MTQPGGNKGCANKNLGLSDYDKIKKQNLKKPGY